MVYSEYFGKHLCYEEVMIYCEFTVQFSWGQVWFCLSPWIVPLLDVVFSVCVFPSVSSYFPVPLSFGPSTGLHVVGKGKLEWSHTGLAGDNFCHWYVYRLISSGLRWGMLVNYRQGVGKEHLFLKLGLQAFQAMEQNKFQLKVALPLATGDKFPHAHFTWRCYYALFLCWG